MSSIRDAIEAIVPKFDFEYDSQVDVWRDESVRTYRKRAIDALCEGAVQVYGNKISRYWDDHSTEDEPGHLPDGKVKAHTAILFGIKPIRKGVTKAEIVEYIKSKIGKSSNGMVDDKIADWLADRIEKYGVRE